MRIGYSCWGFLGNGITDTPDGGRSHRRPLLDALTGYGHDLVLLQADRDRAEAHDPAPGKAFRFDPSGFPALDALVLEWRWPIPGRNTTMCGSPGHACDLHRQDDLLAHYTADRQLPTIVWDKDRKLPADSHWRRARAVTVCEASLTVTPGAQRLLFPADDRLLDAADPQGLAALPRPITLAYAGNQYERDAAFSRYFAPAAADVHHQVAGKWTDTDRWPGLRFTGRLPFSEVDSLYRRSLATVLLLPERYAAAGQMTQRIFEAVLAGCLPLAPAGIAGAHLFVPRPLIVRSGVDVREKLAWLRQLEGTDEHAELISACLDRLELFRLSTQAATLDRLLRRSAGSAATPSLWRVTA